MQICKGEQQKSVKKDVKFKSFQDDIDERVSGKLFYRFVVLIFVVYLIIIIGGEIFYSQFSYVSISGKSMQSTLNPNPVVIRTERGDSYMQDGVYIKRTKEVDYGDIIILTYLKEENETIIKRALAFGGDYISIVKISGEYRFLRVKKDSSYVEVLQENYIKSYEEWSSKQEISVNNVIYQKDFYEKYKSYDGSQTFSVRQLGGREVDFFLVPENEIFFMGDNRANSYDAREMGTFDTDRIIGKVVQIVRDGTKYPKNNFWWAYRFWGFLKVCWKNILSFFGAFA